MKLFVLPMTLSESDAKLRKIIGGLPDSGEPHKRWLLRESSTEVGSLTMDVCIGNSAKSDVISWRYALVRIETPTGHIGRFINNKNDTVRNNNLAQLSREFGITLTGYNLIPVTKDNLTESLELPGAKKSLEALINAAGKENKFTENDMVTGKPAGAYSHYATGPEVQAAVGVPLQPSQYATGVQAQAAAEGTFGFAKWSSLPSAKIDSKPDEKPAASQSHSSSPTKAAVEKPKASEISPPPPAAHNQVAGNAKGILEKAFDDFKNAVKNVFRR